MSSKEILTMFLDYSDEPLSIEDIIVIAFARYKTKKKSTSIYNIDDFIPQNLIKLYYSVFRKVWTIIV